MTRHATHRAPNHADAARTTPIDVLFVSQTTGVKYAAIAKCGSTFVKQLLWHIDHGAPHPAGDAIHDAEATLPREEVWDPAALSDAAAAFVVVRNPIDRFLSLYFDKVVGPGAARFVPLRARLIAERGLDPAPDGVAAHRRNCLITLDWIEDTLKRRVDMAVNPHWRPQVMRLMAAETLNLQVLTLDGLNAQLTHLLSPHVPDLAAHLAGARGKERAGGRNRSARPVAREALVSDALRERIGAIYARDKALYWRARRGWSAVAEGAAVPTMQGIW